MKKPPTLTQILDAEIQRSVDRALRGHNSKRSRTLVADTSGSKAFTDIRWKAGVVYYEFTNGYQYADDMDRATFRDWQAADSLGKWWNANWR